MTNYDEMGKVELRAACKAAGIPYGKLNNDGMRTELKAKAANDALAAQAAQSQEVKQDDRHTGGGLRIEKNREKRNGVTRPSAGGKCRAIWDALDGYRVEMNELPTIDVVKALAADEGWNPSNAAIEFYQWRKFNGIKGRSK